MSRRREGVADRRGDTAGARKNFRPLACEGSSRSGWLGSGAVLEPPARVAGLYDIAVVGQPVEHGGCHFGVAEHLRPIGEGEIGGDQQRGVFVELADEMEKQLPAGLAEWQIAEFVDDDEIVAQQVFRQSARATGGLLLFELVHEIDEIEESSTGAGANDRGGDGDAKMSLSRARAADEDRVALGVEEAALAEFSDLTLIDRGIGEDELVDILEDGELRARNAIADRTRLPVGALG